MKVAGIIMLGTIATPLVAFYLIAPSIFITTVVWAMFLGGLAGIGAGCRRIYLSYATAKSSARPSVPVPVHGSAHHRHRAAGATSSSKDH